MATIAILGLTSQARSSTITLLPSGERMMVEIRRMGPQIGVEVTGIDVKTLDDAGFAPIYRAWLDYNILVVRDQELEIQDFLHYSRRFRPVVPHPSKSTRHRDFAEVRMLAIHKFDDHGKPKHA